MPVFVAVWPSTETRAALAELSRPQLDRVRWTTSDQWHVTLRFCGDAAPDEVCAALSPLDSARTVVTLGPEVEALGRHVAVVAASGVDRLAADVADLSGHLGDPPRDRPFVGHLTLARSRRPIPPEALGAPFSASFAVDEVTVVLSELRPEGARYTVVERIALG